MKFSQTFIKTRKDWPADEIAKNAQLLIKAGYIHKEMAGVYAYLPLGLKVIENIKQIVRQEMDQIGGSELIMTSLQRPELWGKTDRWDEKNVDVWFKTKLQNGSEAGLAWSHEEPITDMLRSYVASYRDLPLYVYQFQTKLRNELRAKSGIMRGREFVMKDLYSYSKDQASHQVFYDKVIESYLKIFAGVGLGEDTYLTFASGGAFTQFSHEFQTLTEAGEDTIYLHRARKLAINQEVLNDDVLKQLTLKKSDLEEVKAAEVGNIFSFGSTKSEQLDLYYADQGGKRQPVIMGSYGIGITRLMGVVAEKFSDDFGLVWPEAIAPYKIMLCHLGNDTKTIKNAQEIYQLLTKNAIGVLYDDRDISAGQKLADSDLIGLPQRLVVSPKTVDSGQYELKNRQSGKTELLNQGQLIKKVSILN